MRKIFGPLVLRTPAVRLLSGAQMRAEHIGMWMAMVIFWGLVAVGLAFFLGYLPWPGEKAAPPVSRTAEELLAERFARGEINEEEYRRRLAVLREETSLSGR